MHRVNSLITKSFAAILMIVFPVVIYAQPLFQITKVKSWDTLNLRSSPGVKSSVVVKIPANGHSISLVGNQVTVDKTVWVEINWQGKRGWVSQYFIQPMLLKSQRASAPEQEPKQQSAPKKPVSMVVDKGVGRNQWILRCGNKSPFWRVDVYPKALKLFTGRYKSLVPINYKKQDKNKWNVAKKTHLKGATSKDRIDLTIRYSYARCYDTVAKKKVPYAAVVKHNGSEMKGCCMAMKIN
ncbi:MAG: SH3 domain-containing protein [Cocleimonas sp.]|nr:SH3 domain-containing protein [Cocleimonas sp.]